MNWTVVFLGCFVVGFVLSALSFAFGIIDMHVHFPWETHVHIGPAHTGHMHGLGPINFATLTAFVAWFGGAGYLLTAQFRWLTVPALVAAVPVGLAGAAIVFLLMAKVLWSRARPADAADPPGRHRRAGLHAGGDAQVVRRPQRRRQRHRQGHRSRRHRLRAWHRDGQTVERTRRGVVQAFSPAIQEGQWAFRL
jgi:hypothetical protein